MGIRDEHEDRPAVTLEDVARLAGVSKMTVSRVLNGKLYVTAEKVERVERAIAELGYMANVSARRLSSRRAHVIALEAPKYDPGSGWSMGIYYGAAEKASALGYEVLLHPFGLNEPDAERELTRLVQTGRADGMLLFPFLEPQLAIFERLLANGIPAVAVHPPRSAKRIPHVTVTDERGAREMGHHLLSMGHRRIAVISGPPFLRASEERLEGFRSALDQEGVAFDATLMVESDMRFQSGLVIGRQILTRTPRPTAIFAFNDELAAGVIQAAHRLGLRVPDDVSVAGFDDTPLAQKLSPPLTTVRQPTVELASDATELLIRLIESKWDGAPEPPLEHELPTQLVLRESVSPPPHS